MLEGQFHLPLAFDLLAVFFFALSGALVAYEKDYDYMGLFALALVTGAGGGLIRDGIFLQQVPAFVTDWRYIVSVLVAGLIVIVLGSTIKRFYLFIVIADTIGLGLYAVVGSQKSINLGLTVLAAGLIGIINAVGGGVLRDLLSGEHPMIFKPGQYYALAAVVGVMVFLGLGVGFKVPAWVAAIVAMGVAFLVRALSIGFDIRTHAVSEHVVRRRVTGHVRRIARRRSDGGTGSPPASEK